MDRAGVGRSCGNRRSAFYLEGTQALVEELEWTDDVTNVIRHPTSDAMLCWMRAQVQSGRAQLFRFSDPDDCLYVITRLDFDPTEWVVPYARGTGVRKFGPLLVELARQRGWPMRVHIEAGEQARARARLFRPLGFAVDELVLRCTHGQRTKRQGDESESQFIEQLDEHLRRQ